MQQALISSIKIKSPIYLLDLGCGTGWAVRYVARKMNENGKFVGIDISGAMIDKAKVNSIGLQNVEFYKANSEDLPFPNNYFETIICSNSFHHYLHPEIVLCEVKRTLKP
jgi:ubiquinone/menaquinone biosynthesis C-methylase UbiE